jgi:prephenate dehydrogenase
MLRPEVLVIGFGAMGRCVAKVIAATGLDHALFFRSSPA